MPKNAIQHIEWTTRDPRRLKSFYDDIFDWNFFEAMPGYTMIEGVGGIFDAPDPQMPGGITPYVNVADLGETEAKISRLGGQIHKSHQEVPGRGWFTLFSDPDGNIIGLWQATAQAPAQARAKPKAAKKAAKKAARKPAKKAAKKATRRAPAKKAAKRKTARRTRR
jgi:predicted enzyme related to lactoylglutathione lyase